MPTFSFLSLALIASIEFVQSEITGDLNCTAYIDAAWTWTPAAVACSNIISDSACSTLYAAAVTADGYPTAGGVQGRPFACYSTGTTAPAAIVQDMKTAAIASCPKTCGLCCQTDAYSCSNVAYPRLNCQTITTSQCNSIAWRTIIAQDCPSACGFCNQGGCVDAVTNCANDLRICQTVGMQDFVNTYCQRTCGRCPSTTASGTATPTATSSSTCTSYIADSSTNCASWSANGFCTNTFYTLAQRRARCATTCRIC